MLDQYNRETSQIHAPAALIQKTKEAMRAEEERLRAEETPLGDSYTIGNSSAHRYAAGISKDCEANAAKRRSIFFYGRLRKWTLPLTAAAALVILVSVSAAMRVVKSGGASSDMAAEDKTEVGSPAADMTDAGALADEALPAEEMPDVSVEAEAPAEEMPDASVEAEVSAEEMADASVEAEATAEEMPDVSVEAEASAEEMLDASAETEASAGAASGGITEASEADTMAAPDKAEFDDNAAMTKNEGAAQASEDTWNEESKEENSVVKPDEELTITEVEKKPSVYNSSEAERIPYQEVIFYVVSGEDGEYSAYARVDRNRYVISGKAADREEFLEKAYELLTEESFY